MSRSVSKFDARLKMVYLAGMAEDFGRVVLGSRGRSGDARAYLYFGTVLIDSVRHKRVKVYGWPDFEDPTKLNQFDDETDASNELRRIRNQVGAGASAGEVLKRYLPKFRKSETVEGYLKNYLEELRRRSASGDLSPGGDFKSVSAWARPGGHWSFLFKKPIDGLKRADVKAWHQWLADRKTEHGVNSGKPLSPKTRKNISNGFKTFLKAWAADHDRPDAVPQWVPIAQIEHAPKTLTIDRVMSVLEAIPWETRGLFLAIAFESLRFSEASAHTLEDWDGSTLHLHRGRQGQRLDSPVRHGKTRANVRREPWAPMLREWLDWRVGQTSKADRMAGKSTALFWLPSAHNSERAMNYTSSVRIWRKACAEVGENIAMGEGLRHSVLSSLGEVLPEAALRTHSRHADGGSLKRYTLGARARASAMLEILPSQR